MFTKTGVGGTDHVWFYDVQADGYSLDDKRTPMLAEDKLGANPRTPLDEATEHAKNNLPDILARWSHRAVTERDRPRTAQSFAVPRAEIAANNYDLLILQSGLLQHPVLGHLNGCPYHTLQDIESQIGEPLPPQFWQSGQEKDISSLSDRANQATHPIVRS
jgi:type I restriction enzyme M protein